ncbi:hypothetical protein SIN8267_01819 [Sinobacterium norvegicum]|uniref:DUF2059 domain-containing protein n=1 Tax=Sinobacterium norvegicum TaxID=1641715 RepID=A0ABM9AES3_9GAMM|nr:DUF2059 domain-containing protein [Sinobacterium norvegicum]CAH0991705.1 hypothetical protein SIN8267_01819 [Sinobacterium norvegicum]
MKALLMIVVFFMPWYAVADAASEKEAEKLLNTLGMEQAMETTITKMLEVQLQQNPGLAPYKQIMLDFFDKNMSYQSLKPEMISVYAKAFSAEELQDINAFYATETGRKTLLVMPQLMAEAGRISMQRVEKNMPELQRQIQQESIRLDGLKQQ